MFEFMYFLEVKRAQKLNRFLLYRQVNEYPKMNVDGKKSGLSGNCWLVQECCQDIMWKEQEVVDDSKQLQ